MFNKIREWRYRRKYKKLYPDWEDNEYNISEFKFIWGLRSGDDLSSFKDTNFYTMNDLDLYYDRKREVYILDIECSYIFDSTEAEVKYLRGLRESLKEYLLSQGVEFNFKPRLWNAYLGAKKAFCEADTLEELYWQFNTFVKGFEGANSNDQNN